MTLSSPARQVVGLLRLAASAALTVALVFQIVEKTVNNDMVPQEYFTYFTILSTMIAIVVIGIGGVMALRRPVDTVGRHSRADVSGFVRGCHRGRLQRAPSRHPG
ncbi:MAG: hypothetical protein Q8M65_07905 [Rhodoglobus sp.]|nr:hypothetical protein [Rhodoglobus sp.]